MGQTTFDVPAGKVDGDVGVLNTKVGDLSSLTTTAKTNLVSAVNEIDSDVSVLSGKLTNKIYIQKLQNVTVNSGYFTINYPSGFDSGSHFMFAYQQYESGQNPGYVFTVQPISTNIIFYARNFMYTNGLPPDGTKVSVVIVYIKAN